MDRRLAARAFSVLLILGAVLVWVAYDKPAAAIGLAAMAIASWITMATRDVPAEIASAMAAAQSASLAQIVRDLRLEGRGVHVPCPDGRVRLFIPASPDPQKAIPPLTAEGVIAEGAAAVGLALRPPGEALYDVWVSREGKAPRGLGVEEAADQVRRALTVMGVGTRVKVSRTSGAGPARVRVEYVPVWTSGACASGRADGSVLQTSCAACSLVAMLVAKSMGEPMRYAGTVETGGIVLLDLEDASASAARWEGRERPRAQVGEASVVRA